MRGSAMPRDKIKAGYCLVLIKESFRIGTFRKYSEMNILVKLSYIFHSFGKYVQPMIPQM